MAGRHFREAGKKTTLRVAAAVLVCFDGRRSLPSTYTEDRKNMARRVTVLGGGAMGTGCSILLSERPDCEVALWLRNPEHAAEIARSRENRRLLSGVRIPDKVEITSDAGGAIAGGD